ncbi:MAG TPA: LysR family transcriptional regulator, partial [Opitutaceae bacterium]
MDVYTLRSFVVLAEHLHFSRAAKVLNLSQPALTKQIRNLESEMDSVLFEREHHGTRLSTVDEQWLPLVREVLERFEQVATFTQATSKSR